MNSLLNFVGSILSGTYAAYSGLPFSCRINIVWSVYHLSEMYLNQILRPSRLEATIQFKFNLLTFLSPLRNWRKKVVSNPISWGKYRSKIIKY